MPGRRHGLQRPVIAADPLTVGKDAVGRIIGVERGIRARPIVAQGKRRATDNRRARRFLERRGGGRMVPVRVSAQDCGNAPPPGGAQDCIDMAGAVRIGGTTATSAPAPTIQVCVPVKV
jgi:hypothetical protein